MRLARYAVPFLKAARNCTPDRPCRHYDPCARCQAEAFLTDEDWVIVRFYCLVADQYVNQAPMGTGGGPPRLTPRLEAYEAVLRLHRYPESLHGWLSDGAVTLARLLVGTDVVNWPVEFGKSLRFIGLGEVE